MKKLIVLAGWFLWTSCYATSCIQVGNTMYCGDGQGNNTMLMQSGDLTLINNNKPSDYGMDSQETSLARPMAQSPETMPIQNDWLKTKSFGDSDE